jgi:hypothetical protein
VESSFFKGKNEEKEEEKKKKKGNSFKERTRIVILKCLI